MYLIVANWKMNPPRVEDALKLYKETTQAARKCKNLEVAACVPAAYLSPLSKSSRSLAVALGAQDLFTEPKGAYTGEHAGTMLKGVGAEYVLVGHSERRAQGEDDELISRKLLAAHKARLTPILCVGESERDSHGEYLKYVGGQIERGLQYITGPQVAKTVIAYEPVWAIGEGAQRAAEPRDVEEMSLYIRRVIADRIGPNRANKMKLLYGGSVDASNAPDFLTGASANGLLVGRASLKSSFSNLLSAVNDI